MGDIVRPGRRANQLTAYSQPLTAAQRKNWGKKIKPLGFEGPAGKLGSAFVGGAGSDPWKAYLKGNYAHGEERQGARQNLRQLSREWGQSDYNTRYTDMPKNFITKQFGKFIGEQQQTPEMGYNPFGAYSDSATTGSTTPTFVSGLSANPSSYDKWAAKKEAGKMEAPLGSAAWYAPAHQNIALNYGGERVGRLLEAAIASGDPTAIQKYFTSQGKKLSRQAIGQAIQGGYIGDADRTYLRDLGWKLGQGATPDINAVYASRAAARGQEQSATPGVDEETGVTSAQAATDKIKAQAEAMGLPLTPEFEAQMRVYEDQLSAQLAQLGIAKEQIQPMVDLALERMATQQGIETGSLREGLVDRGIYDSGTTTRDWSRLNADYTRQQQDLAMSAAQQYADIAGQEGEAYLNYQQQMIEALIQRALDAAQNVPLGLPTSGYEGVTGTKSSTRASRRRDRRRDRRLDRRAS